MLNEKMRIAGLAAAIFAGTLGGAFAQTDNTATQPAGTVTDVREGDDDGFDLGWLGLLGLLGLAGLARRKDHVARHTTTTMGTTGTTGTTGTNRL